MNSIRFVCLAAAALTGSVAAQTGNPYNGKWTVSFDGSRTVDLTGTIVIKDDGGTWDVLAQSRKNPCVGRAYPISIQKADADELVFTVNRAITLVGCKDSTYTFKKVSDGAMKGELGDGRAAMLTRN